MALKQRLYEKIIRPHLKNDPDGETLLYFYNQALRAWTLGVEKEEIENMLIVEKICKTLCEKDEKIVINLISKLLEKMHDEREITERQMGKANSLEDISEIGEKYDVLLEYYKTLYETELRMWLTLPYVYICEFIKQKLKKADYEDYISAPASEKRYELNNLKNPTLQGDLRKLSVGFDNKIRNAGKGHNDYEVTDNGTLLLRIKDKKTHKVISKIELNENQLKEKIKLMERKLWPLEIGIIIFLINNPDIRKKIQPKNEHKIKEIERLLGDFVKQRQMTMKKFDFKERKVMNLEIYQDLIVGRSTTLYMDGAPPTDIYVDETEVSYEAQIMDIMKYALYLNQNKPFCINIKVYDDKKDCLMDLEFSEDEIKKLESNKRQKINPFKGEISDRTYKLVVEHAVPYGIKKEDFERELKSYRAKKKPEKNF